MVVRKTAELLPRIAANGQLECEPVIFRQGRFWTTRLPVTKCITTFEQTRDQFLSALTRFSRSSNQGSIEAAGGWVGLPFRHSSDDSGLGILRAPLNAYWKWDRYSMRKFGFRDEVVFSKGDILLLPDGYWNLMEIWDAVAQARSQGANIACILYDLVCVSHPQFVTPRMRRSFLDYLQKLTACAELVVTISQDVKRHFMQYAATSLPGPLPEVTHFRLGADAHRAVSPPRKELAAAFSPGPKPYVMIATLEPRKNHAYVLDAFETLWARGSDTKLILAGRKGWDCDEVVSRITGHPAFQKQLYLYHDLTNSEIAHCYENAEAVILASFSEGFGLPIVEGQWHGCRVLASDTPVHREVGRDQCEYFDLRDPQALVGLLETRDQSEVLSTNRLLRPDTWEDSIGSLILKIMEFASHDVRCSSQVTALTRSA